VIVPFAHVLFLAAVVFLMGALCTLLRRNLVMILLGIEIMLNASGIALVGGSLRWMNLEGQALVLLVMAVAAAEVSVGLSLIVFSRRFTGSLNADAQNRLKG
jgi:NADH-quinone oxidoreductase subunit K